MKYTEMTSNSNDRIVFDASKVTRNGSTNHTTRLRLAGLFGTLFVVEQTFSIIVTHTNAVRYFN